MASLRFDKVTVSYPVYDGQGMSLRNHLLRIGTGGIIERQSGQVKLVTALRDVSFQLERGDAVGLLGHNGAGKSTLLRTMAGIYSPTSGRSPAKVSGHHAGTGCRHGHGAVRLRKHHAHVPADGRNQKAIGLHMEEIEEFTQLGNFLQMPVRTYSSGMLARLVFAIATSTRPDILLVDEVFGLGDAEFQAHAQKRMEALVNSVGIFVFASHFSELLKRYCNRFFRLEHGQLSECGHDDF